MTGVGVVAVACNVECPRIMKNRSADHDFYSTVDNVGVFLVSKKWSSTG